MKPRMVFLARTEDGWLHWVVKHGNFFYYGKPVTEGSIISIPADSVWAKSEAPQ
jgi:hypothetical protein